MGSIFLMVTLWSCDVDKNYLKHDLQSEKSGDCSGINPAVGVVANTIGERYTFERCLGDDFNGTYEIERKNDTIDVRLKSNEGNKIGYRITLDINSGLPYKYLSIDGSVFQVQVKRF